MAQSLAETIEAAGTQPPARKMVRGPGGILTEESTAGLQQLAANAGLPSPPMTPAGAGQLGASPQQQKMVGTPAQKDAALQIAQNPQQYLGTAQRQDTTRTEETAEERQRREKSQQMGGLSNLGDRVQDTINKFIQTGTQAAPTTQLKASSGAITAAAKLGVLDQNAPAFQAALNAYIQSGGTDAQAIANMNLAAGKDATNMMSKEDIDNLLAGTGELVASTASEAIKPENVTISDLISQGGLPYTGQQLEELLGLPAGATAGMTLAQLQASVKQEQDKEFSRGTSTAAEAITGGQAEQAAARGALRGFSGVGVTSAEKQVADIQQAVARGDQVNFGGKQYSVTDLLSDATIQGIVKDYFSDPNSESSKELAAQNPEFVQFLTKNSDALTAATHALDIGVDNFRALQTKRQDLVGGLGNLPPDVQAALGIPTDKFITSESQLASVKPVVHMAQTNPAIRGELADPDNARALADLSEDELNRLQIGKAGSKWDQYKQAQRDMSAIANIPDGDLDHILQATFGTSDTGSVFSQYQNEASRQTLGLDNKLADWSMIDADHDGRIDDPAQIKQRILQSGASLKDVLAGKKAGYQPKATPSTMSTFDNAYQEGAYNKLSPFAADGKITPDEVGQANLSLRELMEMRGKGGGMSSPDTQAALQAGIDRIDKQQFDDMYSKVAHTNEYGAMQLDDNAFNDLMASSDPNLDKDYLRAQYNRLKDDIRKASEKKSSAPESGPATLGQVPELFADNRDISGSPAPEKQKTLAEQIKGDVTNPVGSVLDTVSNPVKSIKKRLRL